ncbi:MAG: DUF6588 family protein, partial [Fidelibacterota bacterium]
MRRKIITPILVLILLLFANQFASGQNNDEESLLDKIQKMAEEIGKNYLKPFVTAFGTNLNSGLYHTAKTHGILGFDLGLRVMTAFVPEEDKTFNAVLPDSVGVGNIKFASEDVYGEGPYETATVFGDKDAGLNLPATIQGPPPFTLPGGLGITTIPLI